MSISTSAWKIIQWGEFFLPCHSFIHTTQNWLGPLRFVFFQSTQLHHFRFSFASTCKSHKVHVLIITQTWICSPSISSIIIYLPSSLLFPFTLFKLTKFSEKTMTEWGNQPAKPLHLCSKMMLLMSKDTRSYGFG